MSVRTKAKGVLWASNNVQHIVNLTTPPKPRPRASSSRSPPKSILRKSPQTFPPPSAPALVLRDVTPQPDTPTDDSNYLAGPLKVIILGTDPLPDIVEAYNRLCTRLKGMQQTIASLKPGVHPEAIRPIIVQTCGLVAACDRDIRRALLNPKQDSDQNTPLVTSDRSPKKGGMSDEEAKQARDMHLACLAALRLASLLLSSSYLQGLFSTAQLLEILTAVLSIPLTESIPSLNCRKTYAIAIGVLSAASLTAPVASEAASRITFALRRAIEGELGREGKKGASADGLKTVRDYINQYPQVFMPEFSALLPGIFAQLSGPTKMNRFFATHALGAMANMSHVASSSAFRRDLDSTLGEAYQTLLKNLRAALAPDSTDAAWALCTLAALVSLSHGGARAIKLAMNVLPVAMVHKKLGIKMMGSLVWRCYAKESLLKGLHEGDSAWQLLLQVLPMNVGLGIVAALASEKQYDSALKVLEKMVARGGTTCAEAMPMLQQIMSFDVEACLDQPYDLSRYVPVELFDGTLLYNSYNNIGSAVQKVMGPSIDLRSIRPLPKDSIRTHWTRLERVWRDAAAKAEVGADGQMPDDLTEVWRLLLASRVEDDGSLFDDLDLRSSLIIVMDDFLTDPSLIWASSAPDAQTQNSLKYGFITHIWSIAREALPSAFLEAPAMEILPKVLEEVADSDSLASWAELVSHLTVLTPPQHCFHVIEVVKSKNLLNGTALRSVWNYLMGAWGSGDGTWQDGLALLAFPFHHHGLDVEQDVEEQVWEECMRICFIKAQGTQQSQEEAINTLVRHIITGFWHPFLPRLAELLLKHVGIAAHTLSSLAELCTTALAASYENVKRTPTVLLKARWLIREVLCQTDNLNSDDLLPFLVGIQSGLGTWIRDEDSCLEERDYSYEFANPFENLLVSLKLYPSSRTQAILQALAPLFASVFEGSSLGHSKEICVAPLTAYFECACLQVPIENWPPIFVSWLREIPAFAHAFLKAGTKERSELQKQTLAHPVDHGLPKSDCTSGDPFRTPRKRKRSHTEAPVLKKRKKTAAGDENVSPTALPDSPPRKSRRSRRPLAPLQVEEDSSPPQTPSKPKRQQGVSPKRGQRLIMHRIILPTLALYEKERGILPGSLRHQKIYDDPCDKEQTESEKWPNSDDTLVEVDETLGEPNEKGKKGHFRSSSSTPSSNRIIFERSEQSVVI